MAFQGHHRLSDHILFEHSVSELHAVYQPDSRIASEAHVSSMKQYEDMYKRSIEDPESFWRDIAQEFVWKKTPDKFLSYNFNVEKGPIFVKWMEGATTNICYNVLDRIVLDKNAGKTVAFYWEGNDPGDSKKITYEELLKEVCKFANVLKAKGVKKGDKVAIYLPMILELVIAMLACARIGAVHSIVFAGFSAQSLGERLVDSTCSILITADGVYRGTKLINLKEIADAAVVKSKEKGHTVPLCIVVRHLGPSIEINGDKCRPPPERPCNIQINWNDGDVWWHDEMRTAGDNCEPEWVDAEDPLFMLYTSGSTGKPKGVLHTTAGYMLYTATTFKYDFDYHPGEIYWCTADIGWITGHSYIVYGPMAHGATSVMFEGTPTFPDPGRMWAVCDKYNVSKFYTAPTAIRSLMKFGNEFVEKHDRNSLKILGTVGEPINPEAWLWYRNVVGKKQCPIVDTYWQTETGGHVITSLPGATPMKPGSATFPFFGIVPAIIDKDGNEVEGPGEGVLVIKKPWPGMMRTVYGDHDRFESVYFKKYPGYYYTGDECKRDKDGYYWVVGRVDDCMNVAGHLLSTAEIESALVEHGAVSEAAVVGYRHKIKGVGVYCFTTLMDGFDFTDDLVKELKDKVRENIGPIATPDVVQWAPGLPKTRSGKIMRRVLRQLAQGSSSFGDQSTLADPTVVDKLLELRPTKIPGSITLKGVRLYCARLLVFPRTLAVNTDLLKRNVTFTMVGCTSMTAVVSSCGPKMTPTQDESIVSLLRCSLCNEAFRKPHTLSCLHTFCLDCITKMERDEKRVVCPYCHQESCLREGTIRPNYFISNTLAAGGLMSLKNDDVSCGNCTKEANRPCVFCEECIEYLCTDCVFFHQNTKMTRNHTLVPRDLYEERLANSGHERQVYCRVHPKIVVNSYCVLCEETTCGHCVLHTEHNMISLSEAFSLENTVLETALEKATEKLDRLEQCASRWCVMVDELRSCKGELNERITNYFAAYRERLERCEEELLSRVLSWYDRKFEMIKQAQKEEEERIAKIASALKLSNAVLKHGTDVEILSLKNLMQSQLKRVTTQGTGEKLIDAVHVAIRGATWDSTQKCGDELSLEGLWLPEVNHKQFPRLTTTSTENSSDSEFEILLNDVDESSTTTSRNIVSAKSGMAGKDYHLGGVISPGGKSNCWQRCRDVIINRGRHPPPVGRDYRYDRIMRNRSIGRQGTGNGEFCHPCDIAVDRKRHDRLIVTDYNNDRVQVFNHFGDFLFTFGCRGSKLGQFMGPTGVAVLHNGSIVVCDSLNNRVQLFTSKGRYYSSFGEEGRRLDQLWRPMGVAVDSQNRIVVVDQGNNRLQVYDSNGDFCFAFAELGHWDGMVSCPNFVAIDNDDNIYVSDEVNMRIQIFDRDGKYLRKISAQEIHGCPGDAEVFSGIAVDSRGHVIVGGKNRCGAQVFTPDGRFLRTFSSKKKRKSRLQFASGIALTSAGEIVVADWMNSRIRFF